MSADLDRILQAAAEHHETVLERTMQICNVPSPTYQEHQRARYVGSILEELGYAPEIDELSNVYARRGSRDGKVVLLLAHIDTVFPAGTEINVRRDAEFLYGPSIGDNSSNVAGMLTTLQILDELSIETACDIVAVGTVGEEGLGNLRGARAAIDRFREDAGAVIVLDGRVGRITNTAVGSVRWNITVDGPGGHSFGAFGTPSAIHGLGRVIAGIADIQVAETPKTTFNVGLISGGTSVNTIAPSATAVVDMRSVDPDALSTLTRQVCELIEQRPGDGLTSSIELVGERPAGSRSESDPLVQLAAECIGWLGYEVTYHAASTDMNIPISYDIPAVCVGVSHGERGHTVHEHVHIAPFRDGLALVTRLCIEACSWVATAAR